MCRWARSSEICLTSSLRHGSWTISARRAWRPSCLQTLRLAPTTTPCPMPCGRRSAGRACAGPARARQSQAGRLLHGRRESNNSAPGAQSDPGGGRRTVAAVARHAATDAVDGRLLSLSARPGARCRCAGGRARPGGHARAGVLAGADESRRASDAARVARQAGSRAAGPGDGTRRG